MTDADPMGPPQHIESQAVVALFAEGGDRWSVWWRVDPTDHVDEGTVAPRVDRAPNRRFVGSVPRVEYLEEVLAVADRAHGSSGWRRSGVVVAQQWLARLAAALDGEVHYAPAGWSDQPAPLYVDLGHDRSLVEDHRDRLLAQECWELLDQLAADAQRTLEALLRELCGPGNVARSAELSAELVERATAVHLTLADAYRAAHAARPGRQR